MTKKSIIGLLGVIGGVAGNLLGTLIEEQGKSVINKYGLVGALVVIVLSVVVSAWLDTEKGLRADWRWHRLRYLQRLKRHLVRKEGQTKFGRLDLHRRKTSITGSPLPQILADGERQNMVETLLDLIRDSEKQECKVLILGEPGSGKTTGIEHLTYRLTLDASKNFGFGGRIPVLAQLGDYSEGSLLDFAAASLKKVGGENGEVLGKGLTELIQKKQIILLLDSLDEALGDRRDAVRAQVKDLVESETYQSLPVIITGRTREDPSSGLRQLEVFEIQDLSDPAVDAFIRMYKPPGADEKKIRGQLANYNLLEPKGLGRNPFWLRKILESNVFNRDKSGLLNAAVDHLFTREWDEKRESKQSWKRVLVRDVQLEGTKSALGRLAYEMSIENVVTMDSDKASQVLSKWLEGRERFKGLTPNDIVMLGQDAQLLRYRAEQRIGRQPLQFRHRLLQEFLTAWAMHEAEELRTADVLERFSASDQYWETLLLLGGIIEDRGALISAALATGTDNRRILLAIALLHSHDEIDESLSTRLLSAFVKNLESGVTRELKEAATLLTQSIGDRVLDAIGQLLKSQVTRNVKLGLIEILAAQSGDKAVSYLIPLVHDTELTDATNKALIAIGEPAIKPLIVSLRNGRVDSRLPVMNALVGIGSPAVPALIEELRASDLSLREAVVQVLGGIGDERAVDPLMAQLSSGSLDPSLVPRVLNEAKVQPKYKIAGTPLKRKMLALEFAAAIQNAPDGQQKLYWKTADALAQIGAPAVPLLIKLLSTTDPIVGKAVPLILTRIGQPAVDPLIRSLAHTETEIRNLVVEILVAIGDPAREALKKAADDEEPNIWVSADQALRILDSATTEEVEAVDPHVRKFDPYASLRANQSTRESFYYSPPARYLWAGIERESLRVALINLKDAPALKSYGLRVQQLYSQNVKDLIGEDATKRRGAAEFFAKVRFIYRTETHGLHQAYSRQKVREFFDPLLDITSKALTYAADDPDGAIALTARLELNNETTTLGLFSQLLADLSQESKDHKARRDEMATAIAFSTAEQELEVERVKEKIIKRIE